VAHFLGEEKFSEVTVEKKNLEITVRLPGRRRI
jgi:hypothetical protein